MRYRRGYQREDGLYFIRYNSKANGKTEKWGTLEQLNRQREANANIVRKMRGVIGTVPKVDNCQICGSGGKMHLDHCHTTGNARGYLCRKCNLGLGYFMDSKQLLKRATEYLCKTQKKPCPKC